MSNVGNKRNISLLEEIKQEIAQEKTKKLAVCPVLPNLEIDKSEIVEFIKVAVKRAVEQYAQNHVFITLFWVKGRMVAIFNETNVKKGWMQRQLKCAERFKHRYPSLYSLTNPENFLALSLHLRRAICKFWDALNDDPKLCGFTIIYSEICDMWEISWEGGQ